MIERQWVINYISKVKKKIGSEIYRQNYLSALQLISCAASILYSSNIEYYDADLEEYLEVISNRLSLPGSKSITTNKDIAVFFDGFGLDNRGLATIYLKALVKQKKVIYITYKDNEHRVDRIKEILSEKEGECIFINRKDYVSSILETNRIINNYSPACFFFYSVPSDVVGTVIMNVFKGTITNYLINLTDHAFWLGANALDYCIEFRDYGAGISNAFRMIDADRIVKIPFYPEIDQNSQFLGFPFDYRDNQKVLFSGGNLYKTLSKDNLYYKLVDEILNRHKEVVFWYAGSGSNKARINSLMKKHPSRVYLTPERKDLLPVLKNCFAYLSTYPISGGLMFQYSALAGKVPLTLLKKGCEGDSYGFLINQEKLGIEFYDCASLLNELDHLINNEKYLQEKSELLKKSVIKEEEFEHRVSLLFRNVPLLMTKAVCNNDEIEDFRTIYLERLSKVELFELFCNKANLKTVIKVFPVETLIGLASKANKKVFKRK